MTRKEFRKRMADLWREGREVYLHRLSEAMEEHRGAIQNAELNYVIPKVIMHKLITRLAEGWEPLPHWPKL